MTIQKTPLQQEFTWGCYGCGKCNEKGLQAETVKTDEGYLCEWHTNEVHVAHPGKYHHGLLTTICFCHGAWSATAESHEAEGKKITNPLEYFYVNRSISYEILKPIPLQKIISILANVSLDRNESAIVEFEIRLEKDLCARASTELVRVNAGDMEF